MNRYKALDLFCGAGGCTRGYQLAGFEVHGVDIEPQPDYCGDRFIQANAVTFLETENLAQYDFIHASPPCQFYSCTRNIHPEIERDDLIPVVRELLGRSGKPYVIENVPGSPLRGIVLSGPQFGLKVIRKRIFESNIFLLEPPPTRKNGHTNSSHAYSSFDTAEYITVGGNNYRYRDGCIAMGIDWMKKKQLNQAIPPAYTEFIGLQIIDFLNKHK